MEFGDIKCFSSYFVYKQNVRSLGTLIPIKLLKNDNISDFIKHIFTENQYFEIVKSSQEFKVLLTDLKSKVLNHGKDDFKSYFLKDSINRIILAPINKEVIFNECWKIIINIIAKGFIGCNSNMKLFKKITRQIIFSFKGEHNMSLYKLIRNWKFNFDPWKKYSEDTGRKLLIHFLVWVFKYLLAAIISLNFYVTISKLDTDERKLNFFYKNVWQSFYDRSIYSLVLTNVICRSEDYCMGKVKSKRFSQFEKVNVRKFKKDIPKLNLILKCKEEFRPIVRYRYTQSQIEKNRIKYRQELLKKLIGKSPERIEEKYLKLYHKWLITGCPKLYFVKADLSNAFGSIDRQLLMKVITQSYANIQKEETNLNMKKKIAQQYKDLVSQLKKPLLVRSGSTIYEWKQGLVQGYKYSPALSEIYYNYLDDKYFSEMFNHSESDINLFIRVVDDYLFITDSLDQAFSFLKSLSNYNNINYDKTLVNFVHPTIKFCDHMTFLGYVYNTSTLQVSRSESVYCGQMCFKIAFSNAIGNLHKFLESRIGQSGIFISGHIFNLHYNSEDLIWKHVFTTFCLSANKFCTILALLCDENEMGKYLNLYKKRVTVKLGNAIIVILMQNKPRDFKFYYCINHFRYLSFKALLLCAKQTSKCNKLVPQIKDYLAKSNCIFGKWREHASRIDINGICEYKAIREICKKPEFKRVVKDFENLPDGFQCYNHKSRM